MEENRLEPEEPREEPQSEAPAPDSTPAPTSQEPAAPNEPGFMPGPPAPKNKKKVVLAALAALAVVVVGALVFTSSELFKGFIGQQPGQEVPERLTECLGAVPEHLSHEEVWKFELSEDCKHRLGFRLADTGYGKMLAASLNINEEQVVDGLAQTSELEFQLETNFYKDLTSITWDFGDNSAVETVKLDESMRNGPHIKSHLYEDKDDDNEDNVYTAVATLASSDNQKFTVSQTVVIPESVYGENNENNEDNEDPEVQSPLEILDIYAASGSIAFEVNNVDVEEGDLYLIQCSRTDNEEEVVQNTRTPFTAEELENNQSIQLMAAPTEPETEYICFAAIQTAAGELTRATVEKRITTAATPEFEESIVLRFGPVDPAAIRSDRGLLAKVLDALGQEYGLGLTDQEANTFIDSWNLESAIDMRFPVAEIAGDLEGSILPMFRDYNVPVQLIAAPEEEEAPAEQEEPEEDLPLNEVSNLVLAFDSDENGQLLVEVTENTITYHVTLTADVQGIENPQPQWTVADTAALTTAPDEGLEYSFDEEGNLLQKATVTYSAPFLEMSDIAVELGAASTSLVAGPQALHAERFAPVVEEPQPEASVNIDLNFQPIEYFFNNNTQSVELRVNGTAQVVLENLDQVDEVLFDFDDDSGESSRFLAEDLKLAGNTLIVREQNIDFDLQTNQFIIANDYMGELKDSYNFKFTVLVDGQRYEESYEIVPEQEKIDSLLQDNGQAAPAGLASILSLPGDDDGKFVSVPSEGEERHNQALLVEAGDVVLFVPTGRQTKTEGLEIFIAGADGEEDLIELAILDDAPVVAPKPVASPEPDPDSTDDENQAAGIYRLVVLQADADNLEHQRAISLVHEKNAEQIDADLQAVADTFYLENDPSTDFKAIWLNRAQSLFLDPTQSEPRIDNVWTAILERIDNGEFAASLDETSLAWADNFIRSDERVLYKSESFDAAFKNALILRSAGIAVDIVERESGYVEDIGALEYTLYKLNLISVSPNITEAQRQQLKTFIMAKMDRSEEDADKIVSQLADAREAVEGVLLTFNEDLVDDLLYGLRNELGFVNAEVEECDFTADFNINVLNFDDNLVRLKFTNQYKVEGLAELGYDGLYIDFGDGSAVVSQDDEDIRIADDGSLRNLTNDNRVSFEHEYARPVNLPLEVTMYLQKGNVKLIPITKIIAELEFNEDGTSSIQYYTKAPKEGELLVDPPIDGQDATGDDDDDDSNVGDDDDDDDDDQVVAPNEPDPNIYTSGGGGSRDAPGLDGETPAGLAPIPATPGSRGGSSGGIRIRGKLSANDIMRPDSGDSTSSNRSKTYREGMTHEEIKEVVLANNKCLVETPAAQVKKLADIGAQHSAADILAVLTEVSYDGKPIIEGRVVNGRNYFNPSQPILRAEFFKLAAWPTCLSETAESKALWDNSNKKRFTDLTRDFWAYDIVNGLANLQIVGGYADGTAGVSKVITRAEITKLLIDALALRSYLEGSDNFNAAKYDKQAVLEAEFGDIIEEGRNGLAPFRDIKRSDWFYDYAVIAEAKGFTSGDYFRGNNPSTRQFAAEMVYNFLIARK